MFRLISTRRAIAVLAAVVLIVFVPIVLAQSHGASPGATLRVPGRANAFPWIAADRSFVVVSWGATTAEGVADVYIAVSRDAGGTFAAPVRVNDRVGQARLGGELPPRVSLATAAAGEPVIAVTWGAKAATTEIRVSTSSDGGRTFAPSVPLNQRGIAGDRGWHATTMDAGGALHVVWLDHRGMAARSGQHDHHTEGSDMSQLSGLYYARLPLLAGALPTASGAAGKGTAASERELTKGVCYCCKTALATGPDGAIYAAWRHVYTGNIRDIAFTVSRDGGSTFASPIRVSADNWQIAGCPDDGPALAVANGAVHVVWPTVITTDAGMRGAIFHASTRDGKAFTSRIEVPTTGTPKPSHPQIVADNRGGFLVAWDEVVNGTRRAFARTLQFNPSGKPMFGPTIDLDASGSAYPVFASTARGLVAAWTRGSGPSSEISVGQVGQGR